MAQSTVDEVLKLESELAEKKQAAIKELLAERLEIDRKLKALGHDAEPDWVKSPAKRGPGRPRKSTGKRVYNIDPEKKVQAVYKRTYTRLTNGGMKPAEAKKRAQAAADGIKKKLGLK